VNQFLTQYFVTYNMNEGWFLTESRILTSNWMAPAHNRWLVPFGGGIGKITRVGTQPVVCQINLYYNLIRPQDIRSPSGKCGYRWRCSSRKRSDEWFEA
jgi:hypothetical protein